MTFSSLYPTYDVLDKWDSPSWNEPTRTVVARRIGEPPPRRFFTERQWATLAAVCDRVMPQPEREKPVAIAPFIDEMLFDDQGNGTRYASLPPLQDCWRRGIDAIEAEARHRHRRAFAALDQAEQDLILKALDDEAVEAAAWTGLPSRDFLRHVLLREIVGVYYAHPAAWSEIGFGGPASPRGYLRLVGNRRDSWEAVEHAPAAAQELARSS